MDDAAIDGAGGIAGGLAIVAGVDGTDGCVVVVVTVCVDDVDED